MTETQRARPTQAAQSSRLQDLIDTAPWYEKTLAAGLVLVLCFSVFFLALTIASPVLDQHSFRQSQSAINIYYAVHEGALFNYQTPVLGTPWTVPFEGPVYQSIVAAIVTVTGLPIDPVARIVSFLFLLGTVWLGALSLRLLFPNDRFLILVFATLMLASPVYLFWGRTVLIETCAIFLGTAWLYVSMRAVRKNSLLLAGLAVPLCFLAAWTKATTWPAFVAAFALFWVFEWRKGAKPSFSIGLVSAIGVAVALIFSFLWIGYSDDLKSPGIITQKLTSEALVGWNYGQLSERFSKAFWFDTLPGRMLPDVLGLGWLLILIGVTHLAVRGSYFAVAIAAAILFFVPLALFTNLHVVHNYYQTSNALFLIAASAIVIAGLLKQGHARVAIALCLAIVIAQFLRFNGTFWDSVVISTRNHPHYQAAEFIRKNSAPGTALVALGIDWNPVLHYYSERKGLAFPPWGATAPQLQTMLTDRAQMGGLEIGSVYACAPLDFESNPELKAVAMDFIKRSEQRALREERFGNCAAIILK